MFQHIYILLNYQPVSAHCQHSQHSKTDSVFNVLVCVFSIFQHIPMLQPLACFIRLLACFTFASIYLTHCSTQLACLCTSKLLTRFSIVLACFDKIDSMLNMLLSCCNIAIMFTKSRFNVATMSLYYSQPVFIGCQQVVSI